jgi:MarR family transcriptional regulator, temperature-dependent positive regulator of motility
MLYRISMFDHCLYFNTTALARQLEREWSKAFEPFGLTPPQAFMLRAILDQPGLMQSEIAQALVIARPTATRALDGLATKGLIERRSSERDGREQSVFPTDTAVAIHLLLNEASVKVGRRLKKLLGADDFADTVNKIRGVRSALK